MSNHAENDVYAAFAGLIDQPAVARIFNGVATAMATGRTHIHLLFQSSGGMVSDGIALYNFFRALPIPLTLYNVGGCHSIAVIAYLGAQERQVNAHATFMIHRTTGTVQAAQAARLHAVANSVVLDDIRTEAILRERIRMNDEHWTQLNVADLWFDAEEAVEWGVSTSIGDFSPPRGAMVFNM